MLNENTMITVLIVGQIKLTQYKMNQYFPKPYKYFGGDINYKVDLSNYATKTDFKMPQELLFLNQQQNLVQLI